MAGVSGRIVAGSNAQEPLPGRGVNKKPNRKAPKPRPKNKNKKNYGAVGNFPGVSYNEAARLVNPEIRAGLNDIRKEKRQLRREGKNERARSNALYKRSVGDINHVFKESGDYIGSQNQLIQGLYADQRTQSEAAQTALLGELTGQNQQSTASINGELDRLGINMNNAGDQQRLAADQQYSMNTAAQTGANNMANINAQASGADAIGQLLAGMNAGSQASRLGGATNDQNDRMFEIQQNQIDGHNQVREAMSDMRGQRGDLTRQMLEQLAQTRWAQFIDMEQLNLAKKASRPTRRSSRGTRSTSSSNSSSNSGSGSKGKPRGFFGSYNDSVMNNLGR